MKIIHEIGAKVGPVLEREFRARKVRRCPKCEEENTWARHVFPNVRVLLNDGLQSHESEYERFVIGCYSCDFEWIEIPRCAHEWTAATEEYPFIHCAKCHRQHYPHGAKTHG